MFRFLKAPALDSFLTRKVYFLLLLDMDLVFLFFLIS